MWRARLPAQHSELGRPAAGRAAIRCRQQVAARAHGHRRTARPSGVAETLRYCSSPDSHACMSGRGARTTEFCTDSGIGVRGVRGSYVNPRRPAARVARLQALSCVLLPIGPRHRPSLRRIARSIESRTPPAWLYLRHIQFFLPSLRTASIQMPVL
jgi:hypothetical protein